MYASPALILNSSIVSVRVTSASHSSVPCATTTTRRCDARNDGAGDASAGAAARHRWGAWLGLGAVCVRAREHVLARLRLIRGASEQLRQVDAVEAGAEVERKVVSEREAEIG